MTPFPSFIDNQHHRLADVLKELLAGGRGRPLDVATAYFSISAYRMLQQRLHGLGAFRLLLGPDQVEAHWPRSDYESI